VIGDATGRSDEREQLVARGSRVFDLGPGLPCADGVEGAHEASGVKFIAIEFMQ
jgi:hypothetical protein